MSYTITNNQTNLNSWVKEETSLAPFTQSFEWLEILKNEGLETERLAILENGVVKGTATTIYQKLPFGIKYAFCPMGPVLLKESDPSQALEALKKYFQQKKCAFFRFEPNFSLPQDHNLKTKKTRDINPRATLVLDLKKSLDELLKNFHSKTRYNIRLAEKKLTISLEKDLELFYSLSQKTGERDDFKLHSKTHYQQILNSPFSHQINILYNNQPIASGIFIGFGEVFTYLFGASDYKYRQLMAPYLLQWTAIKTAQSYSYPFYDFFGVSPKSNDAVSKQYAGVTRFKSGFNGEFIEKPGTYDFIISSKKYFFYTIFRKLRSLI